MTNQLGIFPVIRLRNSSWTLLSISFLTCGLLSIFSQSRSHFLTPGALRSWLFLSLIFIIIVVIVASLI